MTTRIRVLLAAATTVSLVGAAGPAVGVGLGSAEDVRYKRSSTKLPGSATKATYAELYTYCDEGWSAVSGGQTVKPGSKRGIRYSVPMGARDWLGTAWQRSATASTLTQHVTCLETDDLDVALAADSALTPDSGATAVATCTQGYAVGGGMSGVSDSRTDFSLNASYPVDDGSDADTVPDDGWRVYSHYTGPGGGGDLALVKASCLSGTQPVYQSKTITVAARSSVSTSTSCPGDRPAIGGGLYIDGATSASRVIESRPWDGGDAGSVPDDGWRAGVTNTSDSGLTMTVHAICR